jgi:hypothetical protein|tara:strand:+ start:55 stop:219 length:165 start_codon:yes stop_codon:yes gene_type:complete
MKILETNEWKFIIDALMTMNVRGEDARAFVGIIDKLNHQFDLSSQREQKKMDNK